jgi:hypothetical protein
LWVKTELFQNKRMDNTNEAPMVDLPPTIEQKKLINDLCLRYGLDVPISIKRDPKWWVNFLKLCAYDPKIPKDSMDQKGWRIIETIEKDYYWTDYLDSTARKLNITDKDVNFILRTLKSYKIQPLKRASIGLIDDPEIEAYQVEEDLAYAD